MDKSHSQLTQYFATNKKPLQARDDVKKSVIDPKDQQKSVTSLVKEETNVRKTRSSSRKDASGRIIDFFMPTEQQSPVSSPSKRKNDGQLNTNNAKRPNHMQAETKPSRKLSTLAVGKTSLKDSKITNFIPKKSCDKLEKLEPALQEPAQSAQNTDEQNSAPQNTDGQDPVAKPVGQETEISQSKKEKMVSAETQTISKTSNVGGCSAKEMRMMIEKIKSEKVLTPIKSTQNEIRKLDADLVSLEESNLRTIENDLSSELLSEKLDEIPKGLTLPKKYKDLLEMFKMLDMMVQLLYNRGETVTWHRVEKAVKHGTGNCFDKKCLGQIRYIFPQAFKYELARSKIYEEGRTTVDEQHLTISPIISPDYNNGVKFGGEMKITCSHTASRLRQFQTNLIAFAKHQLQAFMKKTSRMTISLSKVKVWPFNFRRMVIGNQLDDIPSAYLPAPAPSVNDSRSVREQFKSAKLRYQEKSRQLLEVMRKRKEALQSNANVNNGIDPALSRALKGISPSIIAKVQKKQELKMAQQMVCDSPAAKRLEQLRQLPKIAHSLTTLFNCQGKTSLPMSLVAKKLIDSVQAVGNIMEMEARLSMLADSVPGWVKILPLRELKFVKLDKSRQLRDVISQLEHVIKQAEQAQVADAAVASPAV